MRRYRIYENMNISNLLPRFRLGVSIMRFSFMFRKNCLYHFADKDDFDINKLYGISFGLIHNNSSILSKILTTLFKSKKAQSFRLGWNCEKRNGNIQLFAYYYNEGIRYYEYICDVEVDKVYSSYIYFDRAANKVYVNISKQGFDSHKIYSFRFKNCSKFSAMLFPYFGGNRRAPHNMSIYIGNKKS